MPAPNDLTPTRIPNAIIAIGYSDPYDTQSLRKVYNNNLSNIVIGPKKGHQYYFNPVNGNYSWRAGLTPGDNGYLNDGTSLGSTSADSPSRYAIISSFEWWDDYVIYCMGGHTTGPNGNDLLEIFVASGTGTQSLCDIVGKLTGVMLNSTISEALTTISGQDDLLCVNTHYPNIPIYNNVNYYKLKLLIDFGFIPCFPRGGNKAYDISGQLDNSMSFDSNVDWEPKTSNSAGGCIKFNDSYLGVILQPAVASDSVLNNFSVNDGFTINIWVKVDALPSIRSEVIIDNRDTSSNAGYALGINIGGFFKFYVGNGISYDNVITTDAIVPNEWYNVVCRYEYVSGASKLEIIISQPVLGFNYSSNSTVGSAYSPNTTRPFIIGRSQTNANGFNGYISLVSIYDGWLLTPTVEELYKAYDDLTVDVNYAGNGRYWNYY